MEKHDNIGSHVYCMQSKNSDVDVVIHWKSMITVVSNKLIYCSIIAFNSTMIFLYVG